MLKLACGDDGTPIWHPGSLVKNQDHFTSGCVGDTAGLNEFKIANSMFVNTTEVNKFSGTFHQGHVATGNASISASVNESAPVLAVFGM
ncbi:MAG: hypothetical protein LC650_05750, partial [Actinobacteria bacterium]|nr:hypothetical protein [Actinomycetota bacterium]